MMNQETPQKKSQDKSSGSPPQTEEDLDFEILDALENIDSSEPAKDAPTEGTDDEFSVDLDDDLVFDEAQVGDTERFSMDIEAAVGAGVGLADDSDADSLQLGGELGDLGLDADIGDDVQIGENDDGSFSLDLDDDDDLDLSFDDDIDLDIGDDFESSTFNVAAALEEDGIETPTDSSSDLDLGVFNAPSVEMAGDALDDTASSADDAEYGEDNSFSEEIIGDDDDIDIDNMPDLDETMAEFSTSLDSDDGLSDTELADMKTEQESEEFSGKNVISIDGDQVIDLGDEDDIGSIADADSASWSSDEAGVGDDYAEDDFLDVDDDDDDDDIDLAELAKGAENIVGDVEEPAEDQDFMASLDDISIDLHDDDMDDDMEAFGDDVDADDAELPEEDFEAPNLSDVVAEVQQETGVEDDSDVEASATADLTTGPGDKEPQEPEEPEEPEIDVREALGLVPRLEDDDIHKFDSMVLEAKTLQHYIEELEEHQPEIKTAIYYKLLKEYNDRKTEIFREPDFISIRIDVEQDLEDMVRKRDDVQRTVSSLNDELEEVQVRHLVGEYTDDELAEQETSRKAEIETWQNKTDQLEQFIVQYQELLETEKALNPLEDDEDEAAVEEPSSEVVPHEADSLVSAVAEDAPLIPEEPAAEAEESSSDEEITRDELSTIVDDEESADDAGEDDESEAADEILTSEADTSETTEEESADIPMDDLSEEIADLGDLTDMLEVDDSSDWEDGDADDFEITAESFDDDDFSLDADFADDGDLSGVDVDNFDLDGLPDVDDETDADDETLAALAFGGTDGESDAANEQEDDMVSCKKCGRSTPSAEKFCVNCGAKAQ